MAETGSRLGYGLENSKENDNETKERAGIYSGRSVTTLSRAPRLREFKRRSTQQTNGTNASTIATTSSNGVHDDTSMKSSTLKNPYSKGRNNSSRPLTSSASTLSTSRASRPKPALRSGAVHVVCAISENLAKETCVASLDAGSPISLLVTKQGNGQTYAETLSYLECSNQTKSS